MGHTQISLLVSPSHLHQVGHLAWESPVGKEGQSPQDASMSVRPLSTMIPLRSHTCLPLPEKGSEKHLGLIFPSLSVCGPPTLWLSSSGL
uniref:Uncharacterized protein n=1 Tax=Panthera leo TaxID=9689 RepID=A0A8C9D2S7_PANLE